MKERKRQSKRGLAIWRNHRFLIAVYLAAIVAANLSVAHFGPASIPVNAFLFIGLDLTSRDRLHSEWEGSNLWRKMAILVLSGGALSFLINPSSARIAIASSVSFLATGAIDTAVFHVLRKNRFIGVNVSNAVSAIVDSALFPLLAFGPSIVLSIMIWQVLAKWTGGFVWAIVIRKFGRW